MFKALVAGSYTASKQKGPWRRFGCILCRGDIPVFPLEDLDPCDFDIVLVVDACLDEADLPSKSDWTKEAGSQGMGPSAPIDSKSK